MAIKRDIFLYMLRNIMKEIDCGLIDKGRTISKVSDRQIRKIIKRGSEVVLSANVAGSAESAVLEGADVLSKVSPDIAEKVLSVADPSIVLTVLSGSYNILFGLEIIPFIMLGGWKAWGICGVVTVFCYLFHRRGENQDAAKIEAYKQEAIAKQESIVREQSEAINELVEIIRTSKNQDKKSMLIIQKLIDRIEYLNGLLVTTQAVIVACGS